MLTYNTEQKAVKGTNVRISQGFILLTAPLIGLFYVISLPFIGVATVATLASSIAMTGLYNLAVNSVSFGWRPRTSCFSGKNKRKKT